MNFSAITTILFDLDGTLLPLDLDAFMHGYFDLFGKHCASLGYDVEKAIEGLFAGMKAMLFESDGSSTNKERFDRSFSSASGIESESFNARFASFYDGAFNQLESAATRSERAIAVVKYLNDKGYELVLATAPLFPWQATHARLRWAGLDPTLFKTITTYEHCRYTKPHLSYYQNLLTEIERPVDRCLMVGNDVEEDMVVQELGMSAYLVTDCLINRKEAPIEGLQRGSLDDFHHFCKEYL
jgi:FMN phosphatase YigB (HAD superfamily)